MLVVGHCSRLAGGGARHSLCCIAAQHSKAKAVPGFTQQLEQYLEHTKKRYELLSQQLSQSSLSPQKLKVLGKEFSDLSELKELITKREEKLQYQQELTSAMQNSSGNDSNGGVEDEFLAFTREELAGVEVDIEELQRQILNVLAPKDSDDELGVMLEVRAGTGGDEASLFASEIFRMYQRYCQNKQWRWEELSVSHSDIGGFKEAQAQITGVSVYKHMKMEAGVHRVQRVPVNDTKIQTSAASVFVLPAVEEVDFELRPQDLKVEVMRAQGAGGQSVNKTESAVRMTHLPTGITVSMQDERSQIQNRAKALRYIRAKVYDYEKRKQAEAEAALRSSMQGTGDRSDKIRTYNFPQDRVTDHRIGLTVAGVERVLSGEGLDGIVERLIDMDESERIANFLSRLS